MMDRLQAGTGANPGAQKKAPGAADASDSNASGIADRATCVEASLKLQAAQAATGGSAQGGVGGARLPSDTGTAVKELKRLQQHLVSLLQNEYFCDDVEPPAEAFGWSEAALREYFENGGQ